jgi:hypothetical protein
VKKYIFQYLDKIYGSNLILRWYIYTLKYNFINESNDKILGYESLGEDGNIIVTQKILSSVTKFFPIECSDAKVIILEWFVNRYGNEKRNTVKKIFEYYYENVPIQTVSF